MSSRKRALRFRVGSRYGSILVRYVFICLAAVAAYLFRAPLQVGNAVLWAVGLAAALNVGLFFFVERRRLEALVSLLSTACGLAFWAVLIHLTGGASSPFTAGFGLEILLSTREGRPGETLLVSAVAIALLWGQELVGGADPAWLAAAWQTGFLAAMGLIALFVVYGWAGTQVDLNRRLGDLNERLRSAEGELERTQSLQRMGEGAARLAHGLSNTVHSLRGLTRLIEDRLTGSEYDAQLVTEVGGVIDRIQELTRDTLSSAPGQPKTGVTRGGEIPEVVADVLGETARSFPGRRWVLPSERDLPDVSVPRSSLREVLLVVTRNAAEASGEGSEIRLFTAADNGTLHLSVADEGPGLSPRDRGRLFQPGYTTKRNGHGYGLYLSRRLMESHGGGLVASAGANGGAVFTLSMPVRC